MTFITKLDLGIKSPLSKTADVMFAVKKGGVNNNYSILKAVF